MTRKYDESLAAIQEMQQAGTAVYKVEDMEFGRRLAVEKELELPGPDGKIPGMWINAVWDESGAFVLYPTLLGIKGEIILVISALSCISRTICSGEYRDESRFSIAWERRDRALAELEFVSRRPAQEGSHDCRYGCLCEPHPCREGQPRPHAIWHGIQAPALLHVHS